MSAVDVDGSVLPGCTATVNVGGKETDVDFGGAARMAFVLKRAGLHHNVGTDLYRFSVTFRWQGGGPVPRVVVIRSV
jgi:hypothetical protein